MRSPSTQNETSRSAQGSAASRAAAARLLARCCAPPHRSIDALLAEEAASPATRELVFGVLRHYFALERRIQSFLAKPLAARDLDLKCLLLVGAYQLSAGHTAEHAAVNETVEATRLLGKPWARGLINGVLRALQREHGHASPLATEQVDLPVWLEQQLRREYPALAGELFQELQARAPMTLRINRQRVSPDIYRATLSRSGIGWQDLWLNETIGLQTPMRQQDLPGYDEGAISVQDAAAQFAARLLAPAANGRVLDMCAAPGGKLFHLIEAQPDATYVAVESSPDRMAWLQSEARRLGHLTRITFYGADARDDAWWDGRPFDRILLDAPCTGIGTLRRHPDIKLHRSAGDDLSNRSLQSALLDAAWRRLAPGGLLLYVTCSLFHAENDGVVGPFCATHADASLIPISLPVGIPTPLGWQTLPNDRRTDGLFFALLRKCNQ